MSRLTINSNIPSLNAQRNLGNASKSLETSFTRLSSGLRINKASDDAAGLSISESLKADTRIFNQGIRNLNDGLSLLSVADGALNELTNIVTRLSELAEQSANGTLGNKQRLSLDQEAQSLSKEYNRIARSTEFNGRKIFNGDFGDLSLAAGGNASSLITDGLGGAIGDGTFLAGTTLAVLAAPYDLEFNDLNGDGVKDLIAVSPGIGVSILFANADGSFKANTTFSSSGNPYSVEVSDFNNDGIADFVVADGGGNRITLFRGLGNGTFASRVSYVAQSPISIKVADLNQDGISDLVSRSATNSLDVLFGNSDGTFKSAATYLVNSSGGDGGSVKTIDFNGDGYLDLVSSDNLSSTISVSLNNGNGSFKASRSYASFGPVLDIVTADLNNDGIKDIISSNGNSGKVAVYIGNGDGSFVRNVSYFTNGSYVGYGDVADFNGDGNQDIVFAGGGGTSAVLLGNGDGTLKAPSNYAGVSGVQTVKAVDVNSDGVMDLINSNSSSNSISILLGNSNQGVSALQSFSLKTQQDSRDSITYLRQTLNRLSNQRGEIGAFQSRVETGVSNLQQSSLNYNEANSRITDIDVAEESSRLTATRILQQSATSVLAQANQQPQLVLRLLEDL